MRPSANAQGRPTPEAGAAATVTIATQTDRTNLNGHTLAATLGGGGTAVAWTSSTGTFSDATSLTPTYTPTTIGHQEVVGTPSGPLGAGAPAREAWDVTRNQPVAANSTASSVISTLSPQTEALSDTGSADGVTWSTVVQRYTTGGTLQGTESVTGSTTISPTWTPSALDRDYLVTSTATDAYGRTSVKVRSVAAIAVDLPTGDIGADASQSTLAAITLDGSAIVGAISYLWSAEVLKPQDATYTSTAAPASATSQSTTLTPDGPGDWRLKCVATNATGSTTFERQVSVTRPYPVVSSTLGTTEELSGDTYAPTLSETAGADAGSWLTTAILTSDGSSVTVASSTTTTPSIGSIAVGAAITVTHQYTDAYGRVGKLICGVRRTPATAAEVTISSGAPAQQSSISGVALGLTITGGTASSYAWAARLNSGGAGGSWSTSGFSSSTSETPTYTRPTDDDYEIRCVVTMTDASTREARSTISSTNAKPGGTGIWTTTKEWDFTTDVTNVSLSASASDQTIYAGNGTTPKATVRFNTRAGAPTGSAVVASGTGVSLSQTGTNAERYLSIKCTAADTGITWVAPGDVAIDILLNGIALAATNDKIYIGTGTAVNLSTGQHHCIRTQRIAGPSFEQCGMRVNGGTGTLDSTQNSDSTDAANLAIRIIIRGGSHGDVYWSESTSYLSGVPTPSGSIFVSNLGTAALAVGNAATMGDPFYITVYDLWTASASAATVNLKSVRIQRFV